MTDFASLFDRLKEICPDVSREGDTLLARPDDRQMLLALCREALQKGCPIAMGNGPLSSGLRINLRKLRGVSLNERSMFVRAEAGITLGALEETLRARGFTLGFVPGDITDHTLGGAISARSHWRLGRFFAIWEDPLLALDALLPNGEVFSATPAPRRATGPDLIRLLAGSEGAYGLILSALFRVFPLPAQSLEGAWRFPSFAASALAARTLLQAGISPSVLYAEEREGEAALAIRWEGAPQEVMQARERLARELVGKFSENPAPLLTEYARPKPQPPRPVAQGFLLYDKLEEFFQKLGSERGRAQSHVFLHEGVIFAVEGADPEAFYDLIIKEGGIPAPASALYELRDRIAARVLGVAASPMRAVKQALDPENLFVPLPTPISD